MLRSFGGVSLEPTLPTNGSLQARKAAALKAAGLRCVMGSLDSPDDAVFRRMNGMDFPVTDVLAGIEAALASGLGSVKVNMVVKRGTNNQKILQLARHFREQYGGSVTLRFIEYMDVSATKGWRMHEVPSSAEVIGQIAAGVAVRAIRRKRAGKTVQRRAYASGGGEIGVISSVTQAFRRIGL
ncbi:hypothetical protein ASD34_12370 [Variovorax sp. Root473]|nr:hypothetical protein ASD34_12370 [Variovorax sp. Root473]